MLDTLLRRCGHGILPVLALAGLFVLFAGQVQAHDCPHPASAVSAGQQHHVAPAPAPVLAPAPAQAQAEDARCHMAQPERGSACCCVSALCTVVLAPAQAAQAHLFGAPLRHDRPLARAALPQTSPIPPPEPPRA